MLKIIALGFVLSLAAGRVWADEAQLQNDQWAQPSETAAGKETDARALDKRLPPLLPGEEVTTQGKTMKIWTSSGPVSVGDVHKPASPDTKDSTSLGKSDIDDVDIIVDRRKP